MIGELVKTGRMAGAALVAALIAILVTHVFDEMKMQNAFVHLCQARAGTYSVDPSTGVVLRRERLACLPHSQGRGCRDVAFPGDRLSQHGLVPFGLFLDRQRGEGPISVDYLIYRNDGQHYIMSLDFKGPKPGFSTVLDDWIGFGPSSNVSCFDL